MKQKKAKATQKKSGMGYKCSACGYTSKKPMECCGEKMDKKSC